MLYNLMNSSELHQQNERKTAQREARLFKRLALFFLVMVVIMIGANASLVFGIVDATKETSNTNGALTDKGGSRIVSTHIAKRALPLKVAPVLDLGRLKEIDHLQFHMTTTDVAGNSARALMIIQVGVCPFSLLAAKRPRLLPTSCPLCIAGEGRGELLRHARRVLLRT